MNNQCHMLTCRYNHKAECIDGREYKICTDVVKQVLGEDRYNSFLEWEKLEIKRKELSRMNKPIEELIQRLKEPDYKYYGCELSRGEAELAISALEKQIPKKPVRDREYTLCPNCKKVEIDWLDNYCHGCGQRLDWSVGE